MTKTGKVEPRWARLLRIAILVGGAAAGGATLLTPQPAQAWWRGGFWGPSVVIAPPVVVAPPAVYAPPPPVVYAPGPVPYAYVRPHRFWVPGHWRGPYWVPGHWG